MELKMDISKFMDNLNASVTICDTSGIIIYMNDKAVKTFEKYGGNKLINTNILDCHPEPAKTKLAELIKTQKSNYYTIEKDGIKKLLYQFPWYEGNEYKGYAEIVLEIPFDMPHFIRK